MHFQQDCQVRDGGVDDQDGLDGGFPDFLQVFLYLIVMQCHKVAISSSPSSSPTGDHQSWWESDKAARLGLEGFPWNAPCSKSIAGAGCTEKRWQCCQCRSSRLSRLSEKEIFLELQLNLHSSQICSNLKNGRPRDAMKKKSERRFTWDDTLFIFKSSREKRCSGRLQRKVREDSKVEVKFFWKIPNFFFLEIFCSVFMDILKLDCWYWLTELMALLNLEISCGVNNNPEIWK